MGKLQNESTEHNSENDSTLDLQTEIGQTEKSASPQPAFLLNDIHLNIEQQFADFRNLHRQRYDTKTNQDR